MLYPGITKRKLYRRDRGLCAYCGERITENDAEAEHIIPNSRGGKYTWMNLVVSCRPCNQRKGNRTPEMANMSLLYAPYMPSLYEDMISKAEIFWPIKWIFWPRTYPRIAACWKDCSGSSPKSF